MAGAREISIPPLSRWDFSSHMGGAYSTVLSTGAPVRIRQSAARGGWWHLEVEENGEYKGWVSGDTAEDARQALIDLLDTILGASTGRGQRWYDARVDRCRAHYSRKQPVKDADGNLLTYRTLGRNRFVACSKQLQALNQPRDGKGHWRKGPALQAPMPNYAPWAEGPSVLPWTADAAIPPAEAPRRRQAPLRIPIQPPMPMRPDMPFIPRRAPQPEAPSRRLPLRIPLPTDVVEPEAPSFFQQLTARLRPTPRPAPAAPTRTRARTRADQRWSSGTQPNPQPPLPGFSPRRSVAGQRAPTDVPPARRGTGTSRMDQPASVKGFGLFRRVSSTQSRAGFTEPKTRVEALSTMNQIRQTALAGNMSIPQANSVIDRLNQKWGLAVAVLMASRGRRDPMPDLDGWKKGRSVFGSKRYVWKSAEGFHFAVEQGQNGNWQLHYVKGPRWAGDKFTLIYERLEPQEGSSTLQAAVMVAQQVYAEFRKQPEYRAAEKEK